MTNILECLTLCPMFTGLVLSGRLISFHFHCLNVDFSPLWLEESRLKYYILITDHNSSIFGKLAMMNIFFPIRSIHADAVRNKPEQI